MEKSRLEILRKVGSQDVLDLIADLDRVTDQRTQLLLKMASIQDEANAQLAAYRASYYPNSA